MTEAFNGSFIAHNSTWDYSVVWYDASKLLDDTHAAQIIKSLPFLQSTFLKSFFECGYKEDCKEPQNDNGMCDHVLADEQVLFIY